MKNFTIKILDFPMVIQFLKQNYIRSMFLDVGVEPHDVTEDMPDIMEIRKKESPGENSFYNDPDINQMSIQVRRS